MSRPPLTHNHNAPLYGPKKTQVHDKSSIFYRLFETRLKPLWGYRGTTAIQNMNTHWQWYVLIRVSFRSEKDRLNIDSFRGFIEIFGHFLNRSETQILIRLTDEAQYPCQDSSVTLMKFMFNPPNTPGLFQSQPPLCAIRASSTPLLVPRSQGHGDVRRKCMAWI